MNPPDWIEQISQLISKDLGDAALEQVSISCVSDTVLVSCDRTKIGERIAYRAWKNRCSLTPCTGLMVRIGGRIYGEIYPKRKKMLKRDDICGTSDWLLTPANQELVLEIAQNDGTVYLVDCQSEKIRAVVPFLGIEKHLSLPPSELIGKPLDFAAIKTVGDARARVAREGFRSQSRVRESYEILFEEQKWLMEVVFVPLNHPTEGLIICRNKDESQRLHWHEVASSTKA